MSRCLHSFYAKLLLVFLLSIPLQSCVEYDREMAIRAVNKEYSAGQISLKQRDQKIAAIRKAYADYTAQWVANMKAQMARNQASMGSQASSQNAVYTYRPPPEYMYVYNHDPGPKPTYTPPPETYVYHQDPGPKPTYIPPPETYVYNQDPGPKPTYTPPLETYVYNQQPQRPQQEYKPDPPPQYVYRKDMTPEQRKEFDKQYPQLQPGRIQADTTTGLQQGLDRENAMWKNGFGPKGPEYRDELAKSVIAGGVVKYVEPLKGVKAGNSFLEGLSGLFKSKAKKGVENVIDSTASSSQKRQ